MRRRHQIVTKGNSTHDHFTHSFEWIKDCKKLGILIAPVTHWCLQCAT